MNYFSKKEKLLYISSVSLILISFYLFDRVNYLTLIASLIGVTSLIYNAKGNPIGQILMIIFSIIYGYISLTFSYYGEMMTYLGMTLPMAVFALVSWLKNPYKGNKAEVKVNTLNKLEIIYMMILSIIITIIFYFILKYFHTTNLFFSTLSVLTSFLAAYLTMRRSPYFALLYACNDLVLIVLWIYASYYDKMYISVVVCFIAFLFNDFYGFCNWEKMKRKQENEYGSISQ